jgi:NAD(P)-dependent dehydrogenase (short-subunit alcohol dehydrogenase family)
MRLKDRTALVTGGGRGIGRAIALALAREGARVAVSARSAAELDEVVGAIQKQGGQALALAADLAQRDVVKGLLPRIKQHWGPLDILVNNAGIGSSSSPRPVVDFDDEFWDLSMFLNATVPYLLCKAALPDMIARRRGRILNVSSINAKVASLHGAAYTASKHALSGFTKTLALEVAKEGITVNAICPGPVKTIMNDRRIEYDAKRRGIGLEELEASLTPLGRRLEPDEVAPLAVFLASDEAKAITGQSLNVCGGLCMV